MWPMFANSFRLLIKGKLFRDPKAVVQRWLVGVGAALLAVIVVREIGLPLWLSVVVASLGTGLLQPYLFRDLKYN